MRLLFVGDIYGEPGRNYFFNNIDSIKEKYKANIVVVNGENIVNGRGINLKVYKELMNKGVAAITMGNHTFGNKEIYDFLEGSKIVIPANYPTRPSQGYITIKYNDKTLTIINLLGRIFMNPQILDCPFKVCEEILSNVKSDYYLIDFHGEATSEKVAFGHYFDGLKNAAIVGTHTHIQTSDERVLPNGTMYITDVGMTGPLNGVIGVDAQTIIDLFTKCQILPKQAATGPCQFNAVLIDYDNSKITRINFNE